MSWVEVGGAGWRCMEVGARFSNTQVKTKKLCVSREMFIIEFKVSKLGKSIVLRCLRANKTVGCSGYSICFA